MDYTLKKSENVINIDELYLTFTTYKGTLQVLNGINLNIHKEGITGIVGESGSGKTMTSLSILGLIEPPGKITSGSIMFKGLDLLKLDKKAARRAVSGKISFIPQGSRAALNPVFTVGEQVSRIYRVHRGMSKAESLNACAEAFRAVGIPEPNKRLKAYPHELSGGMCQRVLIVMGIASQPELLIADEPTTGLDVTVQAQILEMVSSMVEKERSACMLITHDLGVVAEVCDYMAVVYAGQVMEYGTVKEIFASPKHPYTQKLLDATLRVDIKKPITSISGAMPDLMNLNKGCKFVDRCHCSLSECRETEPEAVWDNNGRYLKCYKAGENL